MAAQALPFLVAAGALVALSGGKKKRSKPSQKPEKDEIVKDGAVDESELEEKDELSPEENGDFETEEESIELQDGEEEGDKGEDPEPEPSPQELCEEFMAAAHVVPSSDGEIPINNVAVEESVLPAMRGNAKDLADSIGYLDPEAVGPVLVVRGLQSLVPVCEWKYDEQNDEFTYSGGKQIQSEIAKDVLYGLIELSLSVIEETNQSEAKMVSVQQS